jgi:hypothetical protein
VACGLAQNSIQYLVGLTISPSTLTRKNSRIAAKNRYSFYDLALLFAHSETNTQERINGGVQGVLFTDSLIAIRIIDNELNILEEDFVVHVAVEELGGIAADLVVFECFDGFIAGPLDERSV